MDAFSLHHLHFDFVEFAVEAFVDRIKAKHVGNARIVDRVVDGLLRSLEL
jgi:hypothetical protein